MQVEGHKKDPLPAGSWTDFLQKTGLSLACLLLASAGICWIAANWAQASAFQKLAGAQAVLVVLVLITWRLVYVSGADKGQKFSLSANLTGLAAVATGALLALVGQIYQTGADPWELFFLWAVLLIPWLLAMQTVFLALLGVVLLNTAGALYLDIYEVGAWLGLSPWLVASLLLALMNFALLVLWEYGIAWLDDRWRIGPRVLGAGALGWLVAATVAGFDTDIGVLTIAVPGLLVTALVYWVYISKRPDLAMVCLAVLGAFCLVAISLIALMPSEEGLLLAIVVLIVSAGLALRHLGALMRSMQKIPAKASQSDQASSQDHAVASAPQEPWYLSLFRLAVMGIMACLVIAFLFMVLDLRFEQAWQLGVIIGAGGLLIFRVSQGDIPRELGTTLMAAGLLMTGIGLFIMDGIQPEIRAACMLLAGLLLYVFAAGAALRFFCAFFVLAVVLALTWPNHDVLGLLDVQDPAHAWIAFPAYLRLWWFGAGAVLVLAVGSRSRDPALWTPLAWALVCLAQMLAWLAPAPALHGLAALWQQAPMLLVIWLACAVLPVLVLAVMLSRVSELARVVRIGAPVALAVASLGWMGAPGIALALTWLILGYALAKRTLLVFGVFALLAYLARFYYQMDSTLLQKSWVLGATGCWLLLSWYVLRKIARPAGATGAGWRKTAAHARRPWREVGLLAGLVLILVVANTGIYQREQILATGQRVVLALAPVDPRSLMQGDYMALRFAVADQLRLRLAREPADIAEKIKAQQGGYLVLQADEQGVYHLIGLRPRGGEQVAARAGDLPIVELEFRLRSGKPRIVTDAWFFPEGQATHFEQARYGAFRVDGKGRGLLTQMLDDQFAPL